MTSSLMIKRVALPVNNLPSFDLTKVFEWLVASCTVLMGFFKGIDAYYKHKREDKREFIEKVVKATMDSSLADFKNDFHEFRNKTETQMAKFNETVFSILKEVKR